MSKRDYSEDLLIQEPTVSLLENELGWRSVFAQDKEDFGPNSLLGWNDESDLLLRREVRGVLERLNPGLHDETDARRCCAG